MENETLASTSGKPKLTIARFEFKESSHKSWEELFYGFEVLVKLTILLLLPANFLQE